MSYDIYAVRIMPCKYAIEVLYDMCVSRPGGCVGGRRT